MSNLPEGTPEFYTWEYDRQTPDVQERFGRGGPHWTEQGDPLIDCSGMEPGYYLVQIRKETTHVVMTVDDPPPRPRDAQVICKLKAKGDDSELSDQLKRMRESGWTVAIHNDYVQDGMLMTFWLFTNDVGRYVKGEACTDVDAVEQCANAGEVEVVDV